jgi:hypothetical protein
MAVNAKHPAHPAGRGSRMVTAPSAGGGRPAAARHQHL